MNINICKVTLLLHQLLIFLNLFIVYLFRKRDCKKKVSACGQLVTIFYFTQPEDRKWTTFYGWYLWLLEASLLFFFNWTSQIHIYKISFFTQNKVILNNTFFRRYLYVKTFCEILWFECVTFLFPKINLIESSK